MIIVNEAEIFQPISNKITFDKKEGNFTNEKIECIWTDILIILKWFDLYRTHNNQFFSDNGLIVTSKDLDLYYLYCGKAEMGKHFSNHWQMAVKMAREKGELKCIKDVDPNQDGYDYNIFDTLVEGKNRTYFYIPGAVPPNKWTGNSYSKCKRDQTLLINIGCNNDGHVKTIWAATVKLTADPDGKSGDWTFSAKTKKAAFSTFLLTKEVSQRPSYQQIFGDIEDDYGAYGDGNALKGMKIIPEKYP